MKARSRDSAAPTLRRLGRWPLTLATGLAAAIPAIAASVRAARDGWIPGADQAIIATRAYDVLSGHPPLVGQYTLAGRVTGQVTHSLGPLLFWLLALPARYGAPVSMSWTMGALNTLAIVGAVALARRRGGPVLMFAAAIAIALMCQSLAAETFHDVWNPSAGLFPFTLLIFLCWSLACGDYRLLPLGALVASFVVQAHLMYLAPTAGVLAVGLGGLALGLGIGRRWRPAAPWALAALLVAALCWSAPIVEELRDSPGNMTLVERSATARHATLGAQVGWQAVVRAVGVRPWWLHVPASRWERKYDVRKQPPEGSVRSCVALLAALAIALVVGALRRRWDVAGGALIGFVLCGALAAVAASTPVPRLLSATLGYTMWWGSQVGMWVWLMVAWSAWLACAWGTRALARSAPAQSAWRRIGRARSPSPTGAERPARLGAPRAGRALRWSALALACLAGVAVTAAVGIAVAGVERPDEHRPIYRPTAALAARLTRTIPSGESVELVGNLNVATLPIKPALRYYLVRHGVRPLARGSYLRLGDWYELHNRPYSRIVYVDDGVRRPTRGARLIDRVRFRDGWGPQVVSLWVGPRERRPLHPSGAPRAPGSPARKGIAREGIGSREGVRSNYVAASPPAMAGPRELHPPYRLHSTLDPGWYVRPKRASPAHPHHPFPFRERRRLMPEYAPGTPSWVELSTPDTDASAAFYRELMGWVATEPGPAESGGYRMLQQDGQNVAGLMGIMQEDQPTAWSTYISVADADETAAKVRAAGGSVVVEPMDVMDIGRMAFFADPAGAVFGVWQPRTFAGADLVNQPNSLCWNEVLTRDAQAGKAFYPAVFGWHAGRPSFEGGPATYTVWEREGKPVGGMMQMTDEHFPAEVPSHWSVCFAVADCDATVARARELGATVTAEPIDMPIGRFAGLIDPQGAPFTIMQLAQAG